MESGIEFSASPGWYTGMTRFYWNYVVIFPPWQTSPPGLGLWEQVVTYEERLPLKDVQVQEMRPTAHAPLECPSYTFRARHPIPEAWEDAGYNMTQDVQRDAKQTLRGSTKGYSTRGGNCKEKIGHRRSTTKGDLSIGIRARYVKESYD
jgi:hypothetical protein